MRRCFSAILQLLLEHAEAIAPDPNDQIHSILKELGSSPSIENLLGESTTQIVVEWWCELVSIYVHWLQGRLPDIPVGEDPSEHMALAGKTEVELTLSPKAEVKSAEDDDTDMKALFVR